MARARAAWSPVWVVVDGSTDGSERTLDADDPGLRIIRLPRNQGKGAAVYRMLALAQEAGFTHALVMDADGQHPAECIGRFMAASMADPAAMILGAPVFGTDAPLLRVLGRRASNWLVGVETLWAGVGDSLFGFRVYPVVPLLRIMGATRRMRRYDFDAEAAVRLCWEGVPIVTMPAPVRYLRREEGGVSHFRYGRDNLVLAWMHARLMLGLAVRLPAVGWRRVRGRRLRGRGHAK